MTHRLKTHLLRFALFAHSEEGERTDDTLHKASKDIYAHVHS
jgi:hypothetical protein